MGLAHAMQGDKTEALDLKIVREKGIGKKQKEAKGEMQWEGNKKWHAPW